MKAAPHILISAGEVSGDIVGARLAEALRRSAPDVRVSGLGGARMAAAGVELVTPANHIGTVGVSELVSAIPQALRALAATRRHVKSDRPDAVVLIGNDVFNALLGWWLRRRGVPAIALFPPQVWLWQSLVPLFARCFDLVLATFPEETTRYSRDTRTVFVGHYLADELHPVDDQTRLEARRRLGLREDDPVIGVLPGSRAHEIERLLPVLGETIAALTARDSRVQIVMPIAEGHQDAVRAWVQAQPEGVIREVRDSHDAMRASDLLLCCSGTATLEAALLGVPHVVLYRISFVTWLTAWVCIHLGFLPDDTIGLPNLLIGRGTILELKQRDVTAESLLSYVHTMLNDDTTRSGVQSRLAQLHPLVLGPGSVSRAARLVLDEAAMRRPEVSA